MPLFKYKPKMTKKARTKIISKNIAIEMHAGKSKKQAIAIAYSTAKRKKK